MKDFLENLMPGNVFRTKSGWWILVETKDTVEKKITGFFATDYPSLFMPTARYPATWDLESGKEITDPSKPYEGLLLESAVS